MVTKSNQIKKKSTIKAKSIKPNIGVKENIKHQKKSMIKISAGIDQTLYNKIKQFVKKNNLSINSLVILATKEYMSK